MKPTVLAIITFVTLQLILALYPGFLIPFFVKPSGYLATLFLNADTTSTADGLWLLFKHEPALYVSDACSGYGFFSILTCIACYVIQRARSRKAIIYLSITPIVWIFAITVNACRITCIHYSSSIFSYLFSDYWSGILHTTVGIFIFLPALMAFNALISTIINHEKQPIRTTRSTT